MAIFWALRIPFGVRNIFVLVILNIRVIKGFQNAGVRTGYKETPYRGSIT